MTNKKTRNFMALDEVARLLSMHIGTIYTYIKDAKAPLPSIKLSNRKILVKRADLEEWLEEKKKGNK